jgi:DNA-binding IclR family transcriptional regulator
MTERFVQKKERLHMEQSAGSQNVAPAPMVERAFRLLDLLSAAEEGMTLSELARALDMSKSSMHGLLKTGVRIIERIEDESDSVTLRISARRGTRVPLLAGVIGRLVLANWPEAKRHEYLHSHPLPHFTERSITDPERFLVAVEEAARAGVSMEREEYLVGVNAVAAPIYAAGGVLVALLWIVGFTSHFDDEAMRGAAEQLRVEAEAISQALGAK